MGHVSVLLFSATYLALRVIPTAFAGKEIIALSADEPYSEGDNRPSLPQKDPWVSCLGEGDLQICCRNCTSCCKEQDREQCNVGEDNRGWGNVGSNNLGDFNFGNNSRGDCNLGDDSFGIGGPDHQGCPKEIWPHIIRFCSLFPYYHKCNNPPVYYGDDLAEQLAAAVLRCDNNIKIAERPKAAANKARQKKRSAYLQRVKVQRGKL